MDLLFQKARVIASDAAKKSQELANQAAKRTQELAIETTKRSKELAVDFSKKADQLKAYAQELTPKAVAVGAASSRKSPTEEELLEYGITPELKEFARGLTIKSFTDFSNDTQEGAQEPEEERKSGQITRQDLTEWQERHSVLVLLSVKEISDLRYVLCPRRMKEPQFWRIYYALVSSFVAPYEVQVKEKVVSAKRTTSEESQSVKSIDLAPEPVLRDPKASTSTAAPAGEEAASEGNASAASKSKNDDLDDLLAGVESGDDGDDDDGFDADFDKLVNSTVEVDDDNKKVEVSGAAVAASDGSSDGELVEMP